MTPGRGTAATAAALLAVAAAGCGLGAGDSSPGTATLTVTRDFGAEPMLTADEADPPESETVIRFLDREAEVQTRYGGGFVQSIDGVAGGVADGRPHDWFFFVNGIESPRGGAEVGVRGGDRIWWDYRDWSAAMRAPAVVGSWPEPFLQAATPAPDRKPVAVRCAAAQATCAEVSDRLADAGAEVRRATGAWPDGPDSPRVLVGPWSRIDRDPVARLLGEGPASSGVFARFRRLGDGWGLDALDATGAVSQTLDAQAGLVAALRPDERPPTWLVTGTDERGVREAAAALDAEALGDSYAVAIEPGEPLALPESPGA